ncbi:hypothetical protein Cme02nite_09750 [Catellatospora methionotrophica]|uniref:Uncharacterized protein n=1 Tax=Catellatospora methionotrophica TaxID=121620 RepID=A0A8J3L6I5_9ACTN|nr:cellulose binding domain-containing protein [Catellatospora methionotrophica]GIG12643.1 hypothetical protein Cme02nite_09750 [Catellatospora methionotrophica]
MAAATALAAALALGSGLLPGQPDAPAHAATVESVITVYADRPGGPLKKAGLGTLFGVASTPDTPANLAAGSQLYLSQHQSAQGDASYPTSTEAVAAKTRAAGIKMIGRYNDLMGGWPYQWKGTADWYAKVDSATRGIQAYKDVLLAVAPFNEPDNKLQGGFAQDAGVPGATYDQKFFWLWTQTFRRIRAIDATVPIMGPNFEHYRGWEPALQERMRGFLANAVATGTVPNMIGWHSLGASPGDVPESLSRYYRPLENQLGVPGRPLPVVIEEYGPGNGEFEGVPGTMVKHWAEFERYGVDYAAMGIYTNPGLLGNTLRRTVAGTLAPNAGWHMMSWYKSLRGDRLDVSRWDTRRYQASDGVASWDAASRTITLLAGGEDGDVDVAVTGLAARGLTGTVRVRLETVPWDKEPTDTDPRPERGGDPVTGGYSLFDKAMTVDASGRLTVPIRTMRRHDGYRVVISPAAAPAAYPTKYEAENAARQHVVVHDGADGRALASGDAYVGGLDFADSAVTFTVDAPAAGMYVMRVRYANGTGAAASHTVTVNGTAQGVADYPATDGWANSALASAPKRVALAAGRNEIRLSRGTGHAELDFIDVRPDTHRYEAELAVVTAARISHYGYNEFPDLVGGIDQPESAVEFTVDAPVAGSYRLTVGYGNGLPGTATHRVLVDGVERGVVAYPTTGAWLTGPRQDAVLRRAEVTVPLPQGRHRVRLAKGEGFAELDYLSVTPPAIPGPGPDPSPQPSMSPSPRPSPSASTQPSPSAPPGARCTAAYTVVSPWDGGFQAEVTVRNSGTLALTGWRVSLAYGQGQRLSQVWNAVLGGSGPTPTLSGLDWNSALAPGATAVAGVIGTGPPTPPTATCTPA